ncbi:hypothetical protein TNCV_1362561 [Trichonephila clavipes]|nr:hypothetical protein TNCV_1362561 [Trichonephila clavipes]
MKHTPRGEQKKGGRPSNNKNERGWTPFPWPDTLQARALQQTGHEWWQRSARAESSSDSEDCFYCPGSSTSASSVRSLNPNLPNNLGYRGVESDLRVSLVNNELVGPSTTVLVALSSVPDHRTPRLASAR